MTGNLSWLGGFFSSLWGWAFVILLLGGSILVHELGHFLAARWRGLKVDRFSIGFGPKIFGWTGKDGVEYRLSWLPLGGYVMLPQLTDLSAVEGEASTPVAELPPVSYLDKMIVILAGVFFNLLLALALAILLWVVGVSVPASAQTQVVGYVYPTVGELKNDGQLRDLLLWRGPDAPKLDDTPAPAYGKIFPGDRVLAVDGSPVSDFRGLSEAIAFSSGRDAAGKPEVTLTVERNGQRQDVQLQPTMMDTNVRSGDAIRDIGLKPAEELVVDEVEPNSPAFYGRLQPGDKILSVNGEKIYSNMQMNDLIDAAAGKPLAVTVLRNGKEVTLSLAPAPVPQTTPLATIAVPVASAAKNGANDATVDILPVYPRDETGNRASPTTPAESLLVWNVDNRGGVFGDLRTGDFLLKVNGQPVKTVQQAVDALKATPAGQPATLVYDNQDTHANTSLALAAGFAAQVTPARTINRIGLLFNMVMDTEHTPPQTQFARAFGEIFSMLGSLFNPHSDIGIGQLSGPIGISRVIYQLSMEDVREALWFAFIVNVNLAILNLLPIPVLDGGQLLFFTIGRLRRKELPINFIAKAQMVCVVLLLGLVVYVSINDSRRIMGDNASAAQALRQSNYLLPPDVMKFPARPEHT